MKLKDYSLLIIIIITAFTLNAQQKVSGIIKNKATQQPINNVEIYDKISGLLAKTNATGYYEFTTKKEKLKLVFFSYEFQIIEVEIIVEADVVLYQQLEAIGEELTAVEITARKDKVFELSRLSDVEETAIYAGKKTEVVLVEQSMANLATNNARQIYSQVAGLNIYQNDDAGLQLNIGGRGLDPNRTANFNTR